jgi:pyruvate/2-oxoglutarate/acetoin dehydrogenase E1 component
MVLTLRETIRITTEKHLKSGSKLAAQCVNAVGFIGGTVPDYPEGIIELPTSDSSNGGIMVGLALTGIRPIYVIRYQGFITYNGASIVNYAAKSKAMWQTPCPLFVRAIGMEGAIGPVAGGMHHSIMRYPGLKVWAPISPKEWLACWNDFMEGDDPTYCSEHRFCYDNQQEYKNQFRRTDTTVIGIGPVRMKLHELSLNEIHLNNLQADWTEEERYILSRSKNCIVIDSDYTTCGVSEHIALKAHKDFNLKVKAIGLDGIAGFAPQCDVLTPTIERIRNENYFL